MCLNNIYSQKTTEQVKKHCVVTNTAIQQDSITKIVYFETDIVIKEDTTHDCYVFIVGVINEKPYGVWFVSKDKPRSTYFSCVFSNNCVLKLVDGVYEVESSSGRCLFFKKRNDSFYVPIKLHKQFRGVESIENYIF